MSAASLATIIAAIIAVTGVGVGYLVNQRAARAERRTKTYAEAMRAARDYREFPYLVWRRASNEMSVVEALGKVQSATLSNIRFHLNWLEIEAPLTAKAYRVLYVKMKQAASINKERAWNHPLFEDRTNLARNPDFVRSGDRTEVDLCLRAMRLDLRLFGRKERARLEGDIECRHQAQKDAGWSPQGEGES